MIKTLFSLDILTAFPIVSTTKKKLVLSIILFFLGISSYQVVAQVRNISKKTDTIKYGSLSYPKAINMAGKQRMLSQRMSKAYLLHTANLLKFSVKKELTGSFNIFENNLTLLLQNASSENVKNSLINVQQYWKEFSSFLLTKPNVHTAQLVITKNTYLLELCDKVVTDIENEYEALLSATYLEDEYKTMKLVNISGKQRMLSQRLCLYYLASTLFAKKHNNYNLILRNTFDEFDIALMHLITNPNNDFSLQRPFSKVLRNWEILKKHQSSLFRGNYNKITVYKTTNKLTNTFDEITKLYETFSF